jgi:hypothetical protein
LKTRAAGLRHLYKYEQFAFAKLIIVGGVGFWQGGVLARCRGALSGAALASTGRAPDN